MDNKVIDTLRILSIDQIERANSGHPGLPMGAATMAYALWKNFLKGSAIDPNWFDRDRFILSARTWVCSSLRTFAYVWI